MATTSLGIYYPDETTNITPLHTVLGAMSSSVDGVLVGPVYRTPMGVHVIADAAARAGLLASLTSGGYTPGASNPVLIYQVDTALQYMYNGTSWAPVAGPPAFASTGARDTAIPSPVAGMQVTTGTGTSQQVWVYNGSSWAETWTDTGWQAITPASGFTAGTSPVVRRVGPHVYHRGTISGAFTAGVTASIGQLPAGFFPVTFASAQRPISTNNPSVTGWGGVSSAGLLEARFATSGTYSVVLAGFGPYLIN